MSVTLLEQDSAIGVFPESFQFFSEQLFCRANANVYFQSLDALLIFNR